MRQITSILPLRYLKITENFEQLRFERRCLQLHNLLCQKKKMIDINSGLKTQGSICTGKDRKSNSAFLHLFTREPLYITSNLTESYNLKPNISVSCKILLTFEPIIHGGYKASNDSNKAFSNIIPSSEYFCLTMANQPHIFP